MKRAFAVGLIGLIALAAPAHPQSLAEAARREKERQEKEKQKQGGSASKVVTEEDLKGSQGQLANDTSIAPAATPPPGWLR